MSPDEEKPLWWTGDHWFIAHTISGRFNLSREEAVERLGAARHRGGVKRGLQFSVNAARKRPPGQPTRAVLRAQKRAAKAAAALALVLALAGCEGRAETHAEYEQRFAREVAACEQAMYDGHFHGCTKYHDVWISFRKLHSKIDEFMIHLSGWGYL